MTFLSAGIINRQAAVIDDFETGDLSNWTTTNANVTVVSDFVNSGSFAGHAGETTTSPSGVISFNNPGRIKSFEYYYRETSSQNGGGFRIYDSTGSYVMATGTDNPQWAIEDLNGYARVLGEEGAYDTWTRVETVFDWGAGTADVKFQRLDTGVDVLTTDCPLITISDVATIEWWAQTDGNWGASPPQSNMDMWTDDITEIS